MIDNVRKALDATLENWRLMQSSDMDDASDDADRFEASFYEFIDEVRAWMTGLEQKPKSLDEAMAMPDVVAITDELPGPLQLNFETELELIVEGITRDVDVKME